MLKKSFIVKSKIRHATKTNQEQQHMLVTRLVLLLLLLCGLCVIECRGWSAWLSHAAPGNETLFCGGIIRSLTPQHELSILYEKDHSRIYNLIKQHVSQEYHSNQCTATLHNNITIHRQELLWYSTDQRTLYYTHVGSSTE